MGKHTIEGESRRLTIQLPVELVGKAKARVRKPFKVSVVLSTSNVSKCNVLLKADEGIFEPCHQHRQVVPTEAGTTVDFTLMPIARTSAPVWLSIEANGDGLAQQAGFFLDVQ